ncbi:MFS family permease [Staphylococcus caledonicus]
MENSQMSIAKRNTIVLIMLISAFVAMLNQTILNTALPAIISGLGILESTAQWLITGFMLVNGIMIPLTAFLMDKYPTRKLYIFSMAAFLIGSILAAMSPGFGILMVARVVQAHPITAYAIYSLHTISS